MEHQKLLISGGDGERQNESRPDEGEDQNQNQGAGESDDSSDNGEESGAEGADGDGGGSDGDDSSPTVEEQLEALKRENLVLAKAAKKATDDSKKAKADRDAAKERDEAIQRADKLQNLLDTKFLAWSIGTNNKYKWENPEDVLVFIKQDEIDIDLDTGEIKGLDLALKRIAKDKPYLLKKDDDDQEQDPPRSGGHPRGGRVESDQAEMRRIGEKFRIPGFGSQAVRPV